MAFYISKAEIDAIRRLRESLGGAIYRTSMHRCAATLKVIAGDTRVYGKLGFLQRTATFKARGGGLIGGMANAIRQLRPATKIVVVEPLGADTMHRSFAAGKPQSIDAVQTIADSLDPPFAMPYSFNLCRNTVDQLVLVDDDQRRRSMGFLFRYPKIAAEPARATTNATLRGPLRNELWGRRIVLAMCGSNRLAHACPTGAL